MENDKKGEMYKPMLWRDELRHIGSSGRRLVGRKSKSCKKKGEGPLLARGQVGILICQIEIRQNKYFMQKNVQVVDQMTRGTRIF